MKFAAERSPRRDPSGAADVVNPFQGWLAEAVADALVVRPDDVTAEARGNLWTFGLDDQQRSDVTAADVNHFVWSVVAARRCWLAEHGGGPMWFYCWHDAQAGQFRFSLVSSGHGRLPFSSPVERISDLGVVIDPFLKSLVGEGTVTLVWVTELERSSPERRSCHAQ